MSIDSTSKQVAVRFPGGVYTELVGIAERTRRPIAETIRMIVDDYIEYGDQESRAQKEIDQLTEKLREAELTAGTAIRGTIEAQRMARQIYNDYKALQDKLEKTGSEKTDAQEPKQNAASWEF